MILTLSVRVCEFKRTVYSTVNAISASENRSDGLQIGTTSACIEVASLTGKEATLYQQLPGARVRCTACARYCNIGDGQVGFCGIRGNLNGKLWLYVYGKIIAGHIDPIEKKPVTHYMPGTKIFSIATTGCSWACHAAGTQILLSDGRAKAVEDIGQGDTLWSYGADPANGITNVVIRAGNRLGRLWELQYGNHSHGKLLLTSEHPVFTANGWKSVAELAPGDMVLRVWSHVSDKFVESTKAAMKRQIFTCKRCGTKSTGIYEWNRHRGQCYTEGLTHSAENIAKWRERMLTDNPMWDADVAKQALQTNRERFLTDPTHGWYRNIERLRTFLHRHPSAGQLQLYSILEELGAKYEKEFKIELAKRLPKSRSHYIADAAFPKSKIDIEADGWWHFNDPETQMRDRLRDETLRLNGWRTLRLSGRVLFNHRDEATRLIASTLVQPTLQNEKKWVEVKKVQMTDDYAPVYSFECVPDHTYVANGILVHNCQYCQNADISQRRKVDGLDATPESVVEMTKRYGCEGLAYTYNEPSIFIEFAHDIGVQARKAGLINIFVSNGYDTPDSVGLMRDFLDCITVDFKGSGETAFVRKYITITNADPIFQTLLELRDKTNVHIEITDLIVPEVGDDLGAAKKLCSWVYDNLGPDTPIHFLRFHPDYKMMNLPPTPVETLEKHHAVAKEVGLNYAYLGNVPGHPLEHTYCAECGHVVVERFGFDISGWNLDNQNRCKYCGNEIPIVGRLSKSASQDRFVPIII